ncbi:heavy metal translocating P-type ATPase [Marispirochaeta sp.]|uniref:heavy metal translocating P-type ATPase n=1 Tax=Marispirochaeta sp. TaxID=2038653 RepID=UPI0029C86A7A|nr:heavy metal translocating P-type ATPase [Marispirochaeta sp.]
MSKQYRVDGVDCAMCATTIEKALRRNEGLETAVFNFASGTISIDPSHVDKAREVLNQVEPGAALRDESTGDKEAGSGGFNLAAIRIGLSALLFTGGLVFSSSLEGMLGGWGLFILLVPAYLLAGSHVLFGALRNILHGRVFDELFLMSIASLGAIAIGEIHEAVGVMLFYSVGEALQDRAVAKSRGSIRDMMKLRPDAARLVKGDTTEIIDPVKVKVGSVIEVRPGETIPLDGIVLEGASFVDTAALTGESVQRRVEPDSEVSAGFVNDDGRLRIKTSRPFGESSAARVLALVEEASGRKSPTEKFITRFARVYTPLVVVIAAAAALIPPLITGGPFSPWIYRALVVLVISCPCALVVSIPLGYFAGIGAASRHRILVKGAEVLDGLKDLSTLVFDKTGTLTRGEFRLWQVHPAAGFSREEVLNYAAAAESHSNHPIARSIRDARGGSDKSLRIGAYREEKGFGVSALVGGQEVLVGSGRLLAREGVPVPSGFGRAAVHVAVGGAYAGSLDLGDSIKDEAVEAVRGLRSQGIGHIMMLTGDDESRAAGIAAETGLDAFEAGLLPEEKVERLERIMLHNASGTTAFVGDGINDAPVIMRADVGIAMGGLGSDASVEAADMVIMDDKLTRIPEALGIARRTRRIVWQNILFAAGFKGIFLLLGVFGSLSMGLAVVADVGVALLAVLNSTRVLRYSAS